MTEPTRHLTWENFSRMIDRGVPAVHPIAGVPSVDMFMDERAVRIGLRTPADGAVPPSSALKAIVIDTVTIEGTQYIEVSTSERRLFPEFYSFCVSLADRLQLQHEPAAKAIVGALANWRDLLKPFGGLSLERQIGLVAELWLLRRLISIYGVDGLRCWTGPRGEPHDFRLAAAEFEVKATLSPSRSHLINGEMQLQPSPGHLLWLLSVQLEPAGMGGVSLKELVAAVRLALVDNGPIATEFEELLARLAYDDSDHALYQERWQFRTAPLLAAVEEPFPRITRSSLLLLGEIVNERVSEVHYRINIEGLGFSAESEQFQSVLPIGVGGLDQI